MKLNPSQNLLFLISYLHKKADGFTLLELMIVFLLIGILSAVAVPAYYGQIGKARETQLLLTIGTMARSQQSYHFLYGEFALTLADLQTDTGPISTKYHDVDNITGNSNTVKIQAIALNPYQDQVRNYAVGVYFDNGAYNRATCQGYKVGEPVQVGNFANDSCTNNGNKIN